MVTSLLGMHMHPKRRSQRLGRLEDDGAVAISEDAVVDVGLDGAG